jgi:error-prone DNA polymerase
MSSGSSSTGSSVSGFAELWSYTNYSFLTGGSHPTEMTRSAVELELSALAVTDRNGVYGLPKAYLSAKESSLKLISGAEVRFEEGYPPLVVLARHRAGYGKLCRLLTLVHADAPKGEGCLSWEEWEANLDSEGWYVLTDRPDHPRLERLKEQLGPRIRLVLTRRLDGLDRKKTLDVQAASRRLSIPIIASNQAIYHHPSRRMLTDTLHCIRDGVQLKDAGRELLSNGEGYLKSEAQMRALFKDMPDAVDETVRIAEDCRFSLSELRYQYPSEWIPEGKTADEFLAEITWKGARERYKGSIPESADAQIRHEMKLIGELGFADYFLTIWDIVRFARSKGILCQGRGSAANSAVCYSLAITAIDPIRMNLLFERFISSERGEPPDIDVDFEHERREEVIQYIYEKYGRDRAAMVSAVVTYQGRSARREVAKVFGYDVEKVGGDQVVDGGTEGEKEWMGRLKEEIAAFPRHLSIHSGGFTLSHSPIIDTVPVEPARMEGRTIIQWDKYDLDIVGLLKIDVLALGMLTALRKSMTLAGYAELPDIPPEDEKTYQMIQRGDTVGVFQIESRAQIGMLPRLKPENFYDLVIEIAIVRPGPIVGQMVHPYLRRKKGLESPFYPHPKVKEILGKTLGVPLFQEQVMKMAIELAGFTPGEADELRRAIGAWRSTGSVQRMGKRLAEGLAKFGFPPDYAKMVFQQIQGFSKYGFPESHSASFALLAYASSYLKCHHPAEFLCAMINSQPLGFYSNHTLIDEAARNGVEALPVDPNHSVWDCEMVDDDEGEHRPVQLGFRVVRGMSEAEAQSVIDERKKEGPFKSFFDFLHRTKVRKNTLEVMAHGDAFSIFDLDQRQALWQLLYFYSLKSLEGGDQMSLFGSYQHQAPLQNFVQMDSYDEICADYHSYGLTTRGHPMRLLRPRLPKVPQITAREVKQLEHGSKTSVGGLVIVRQRPGTAKGTSFATLEDETGFVDLILWRKVYEKYRALFLTHSFIVAQGVIQRDGHSVSLLVQSLRPLMPTEKEDQALPVNRDWHYFRRT